MGWPLTQFIKGVSTVTTSRHPLYDEPAGLAVSQRVRRQPVALTNFRRSVPPAAPRKGGTWNEQFAADNEKACGAMIARRWPHSGFSSDRAQCVRPVQCG